MFNSDGDSCPKSRECGPLHGRLNAAGLIWNGAVVEVVCGTAGAGSPGQPEGRVILTAISCVDCEPPGTESPLWKDSVVTSCQVKVEVSVHTTPPVRRPPPQLWLGATDTELGSELKLRNCSAEPPLRFEKSTSRSTGLENEIVNVPNVLLKLVTRSSPGGEATGS